MIGLDSSEKSAQLSNESGIHSALITSYTTTYFTKNNTTDLAGYRNSQVYIKGANHVPPNQSAVRDVMPVLFELLKEEPESGVRAVLGQFIFVYIQPYMDGNGRIARFLMNVMLASGGYSWTVIRVEKRKEYMAALVKASVNHEIDDFVKFIAGIIFK